MRASCVLSLVALLSASTAASMVASTAASAAELARFGGTDDDDGGVVVEGNGFEKTQGTWLHMPSGLVDATADLQRLFHDSCASLDPASAQQCAASLPRDVALPSDIALGSETVRLHALARYDAFQLDVAWQASALTASDRRFVAFGASPLALGDDSDLADRTPQRRLIDFDPVLYDAGSVVFLHNLDQLSLAWHTSYVSVVAGRQAVSWGTGHVWNPTDLFSPFAPTDVDREVRRGADALRVSVPLGDVTELDALWLPQLELADNGGVLRARTNVFSNVDVSASAAKYVRDLVVGADAAGDAGPLGLYAEGAWTFGTDDDASFGRAVAGLSARPTESWFVVVEGYYNGFGAADAADIVAKMTSPRVLRGEVFGTRRFYLAGISSVVVSDTVSVNATAIANVEDTGLLLAPSLEWQPLQSVLVRIGASIPFGSGVDTSLITSLTPADVFGNTDAFKHATSTFGVRSEYGITPATAFIQVGAYFP